MLVLTVLPSVGKQMGLVWLVQLYISELWGNLTSSLDSWEGPAVRIIFQQMTPSPGGGGGGGGRLSLSTPSYLQLCSKTLLEIWQRHLVEYFSIPSFCVQTYLQRKTQKACKNNPLVKLSAEPVFGIILYRPLIFSSKISEFVFTYREHRQYFKFHWLSFT